MITQKYSLLEEAIIDIRKLLKNNYDIKNLKVKITKPDIIENCVVSIEE